MLEENIALIFAIWKHILKHRMRNKNLLLTLQKKYQEGGYVLVSPKSGKVVAFGEDLAHLYEVIDRKKIKDADKVVMHIPPPSVTHAFHLSLSIRIH